MVCFLIEISLLSESGFSAWNNATLLRKFPINLLFRTIYVGRQSLSNGLKLRGLRFGVFFNRPTTASVFLRSNFDFLREDLVAIWKKALLNWKLCVQITSFIYTRSIISVFLLLLDLLTKAHLIKNGHWICSFNDGLWILYWFTLCMSLFFLLLP